MKDEPNKLWEYRIKYNPGAENSAMNSFHYYRAQDSRDALKYHNLMMSKHEFRSQTISVERKCPYAQKWIDETEEAFASENQSNKD
jgi:hypothetical protein